MKTLIGSNTLLYSLRAIKEIFEWRGRGYAAPSPDFIKRACLIRNGIPDAIWVETGTYLGNTTKVLARHARLVYSIEPEPKLYARAALRFRSYPNVKIISGTSEDAFPHLLSTLNGDLNFWLDGHYSGGVTFQGSKETPISDELACIERHISRLNKVSILIDDIRCFTHADQVSQYPRLDFLIAWAQQNHLQWHIEHDIFIARRI